MDYEHFERFGNVDPAGDIASREDALRYIAEIQAMASSRRQLVPCGAYGMDDGSTTEFSRQLVRQHESWLSTRARDRADSGH